MSVFRLRDAATLVVALIGGGVVAGAILAAFMYGMVMFFRWSGLF